MNFKKVCSCHMQLKWQDMPGSKITYKSLNWGALMCITQPIKS